MMLDQDHVYEDYEESGQSWVGKYPSDWKLVRNKAIFTEKTAAVGKRASEYKLLSLTLGGVIPRDMENPKGKFPAEFDTYKIVEPDDLIFCLFDVAETPRAVGRADEAGMITGAYTVLRPRPGISPRFLNYFYLSLDYDKRLSPLYTGLRNVIKIDTFMSIKTPLPDLDTQNRIVRFLDEKTAEIDAAIAKKRRLIDLLNEQKAILINRAVTRGLNPDAPMKDSGVDWIGEIPAHWEVKRVKHVTSRIVDGTHFTPTYVDEGVPFLRVTDLTKSGNAEIDWEEARRIPEKEHKELAKRALPRRGDVLLSKNGTIGLTKVVEWDHEVSIFVSLCLIRPTSLLNPHYFAFFFNSPVVDEQLTFGSKRTSVTNLHLDKIKELLILLPPEKEQEEIVLSMNSELAPFFQAIELVESEISTLNEFKQTLIANAVTGKIKI